MSLQINGKRLKEARLFNHLTMSALADQIGVSKQAISKYEHNKIEISSAVFQKIVQVLNFPLYFFTDFEKVPYQDDGTFYRSRLTATQSEKQPSKTYKKAAAYLRDYFENYIDFPELDTKLELEESPENAANELRRIWNLDDQPISDIVDLMERHGLIIVNVDFNSNKIDARSGYVEIGEKQYYIVLVNGKKQNFFRDQFTLAHELGHYAMHAKLYYPQEDLLGQDYRTIENEANQFASAFLMPKESFESDLTKNGFINIDTFINLKSKWNVSIAAMVHRAHDLQLIDDKEYIKLQKQISYRGWRTKEIMDDEKIMSKPKALNQAFELLEEHDVVHPKDLNDKLREMYGIVFPNEILSQILGIDLDKFRSSIVRLKTSEID
ncbi:helix-turn-helix domain-containing protein [Lactobacillus crispatus]|jgi:transcriptional regulator|uniref:helix-turn-helix domain-containing protein n=1 Tax=Lactobacillus crispatus TaxID=47770 RepID=UPI0002DA36FD|nr:XRE family transcriptional regulator [Lactobacillus crispatus]CPR89603.1 Predicted transcriptional regulator [Chlamydia trachomatis]KWX58137.1 transcriptional regulator [Lactobacillus crispatus]MBG0735311.1 ImmA/IrrE family metallo-endopeptidase [Lactobacillus crispatus]MBG0736793.1 ImmA/IrrE family metallo-endopeptidase [Lactobacillus crispatus]MBI1719908.1 transcriptional regulator [Lactobacillus crispatus]